MVRVVNRDRDALWAEVHELSRSIAAAIDEGRDVRKVLDALDPDPMRFMDTDEGDGALAELLATGWRSLDAAPLFKGQRHRSNVCMGSDAHSTSPSIALGADGLDMCVWLQSSGISGEQLAVLRNFAAQTSHDCDVVGATPTDRFRPTAIVDSHGMPWIFDAHRSRDGVHVWATHMQAGGWASWERITSTGHPSFNQEILALPEGRLCVCWQGLDGGRFHIYTRTYSDGHWEPGQRISAGDVGNAWDPSIAVLPDGTSAISWSEHTPGQGYDICLAIKSSYDAGARRVGRIHIASAYALHPALVVSPDGTMWCAYDVTSIPGHAQSGPTKLRHHTAVGAKNGLAGGGRFVPPECSPPIRTELHVDRIVDGHIADSWTLARSLDVTPAALPRMAADGEGFPIVAYRIRRRLPLLLYYWEVATQRWTGEHWTDPVTYADSAGPLEEATIAARRGQIVVAWQADGRLERALEWRDGFGGQERLELAAHQGEVIWEVVHGKGRIVATEVPASSGDMVSDAETSRVRPSRMEQVSEATNAEGSSPRRPYRTVVDGHPLNLYWGDLHRHSMISRCTLGSEPSLDDYYRYSWDVCQYDFWALTDHSENTSATQWVSVQKMADLFHVPDQFVPFYGFEWTGREGHHNVIFNSAARGAPIFSSRAEGYRTPAELWSHLKAFPQYPSITIPHHPGCAFVRFNWDYNDPSMVPLAEVFQACRGNYEDDRCFRRYPDATDVGNFTLAGLRRGYRFGFIASTDHGYGAAYVGAYADSLSRSSIFAALQARRTFASTRYGLLADVRIGDTFMGGEATISETALLEAYISGTADLAAIELIENGKVLDARVGKADDMPARWLQVPVHLEWMGDHMSREWSGHLSVSGGEIVQTEFWAPEITRTGRYDIEWLARTEYYGHHYGGQRGGIDFSVCGPPEAELTVETAQGSGAVTLRDLEHSVQLQVNAGRFTVERGVGGLVSLGSKEQRVGWSISPQGPAWYYVRAIQVDGEMVWSSPIWTVAQNST